MFSGARKGSYALSKAMVRSWSVLKGSPVYPHRSNYLREESCPALVGSAAMRGYVEHTILHWRTRQDLAVRGMGGGTVPGWLAAKV